jgi:hypothetical protein
VLASNGGTVTPVGQSAIAIPATAQPTIIEVPTYSFNGAVFAGTDAFVIEYIKLLG